MEDIKNIYMIGMMGSGKSSVGELLSRRMSWKFIDFDQEIENDEKCTINQIFSENESRFRKLETKKIHELKDFNRTIFSTGGGIVMNKKNYDLLSNSFCIYLKTSISEILKRIGQDNSRPLIKNKKLETLNNIEKERQNVYSSLADLTINTDNKSIDEICSIIEEKINVK